LNMRSLAVSYALAFALLFAGCATQGVGSSSAGKEKSEQEQIRAQLKSHYDKGESFYKLGEMDAAKAEFLAMLKIKPGEPNANYRLGTIAFRQGQYVESAAFFESVINEDPKNYKAHYNLASIRLMQAENHFKYYAALVDPEADLKKVSELMAGIDRFTKKSSPSDREQSLDQLAITLKK